MPKIAGLQRRHNTWFLRVRVPADVQGVIQKNEIIKSLKTQDYKEAARRIHIERAKIESEFEEHRQRLEAGDSNQDMLSGHSDHGLQALCLRWFDNHEKWEEEENAKNGSYTGTYTMYTKNISFLYVQKSENQTAENKSLRDVFFRGFSV